MWYSLMGKESAVKSFLSPLGFFTTQKKTAVMAV